MQKNASIITCKSQMQVKRYLREHLGKHYVHVGGGSFAEVYSKPRWQRVVKIGEIDCNTAYLDYVNHIGLRSKNPFFPQIYDVQLGRKYFLVEMEKLIEWENLPSAGKVFRARVNKHFGLTVESYHCSSDKRWHCDIDFMPYQMQPPQRSTRGHEVKRVLNALSQRHSVDFHEGNFMFRKYKPKGYQIVITDPVT